jgi:transcriptional regulator with XRE-family HTH domain
MQRMATPKYIEEIPAARTAYELGRILRNERKRQKLTQRDIAKAANISRSTLVALEYGDNCELDTLVRVLVALNRGLRLD